MLSLLTCSVSRLDDCDSYAVPPSPLRQRRLSKSLGFIKTTSPSTRRRRVAKMSIGSPTDFRHEVHLGREVIPENMVSMWDSARWQQALEKDSSSSPPSSIAPSTVPSSPTNPNPKRSSFTPQKRKPVPSLIPDHPATVAPYDIPLPPSPIGSVSVELPECEPSEPLVLPPRRSTRPSVDEGGKAHVSEFGDHPVCETAPATDDQ